jgi:hypothetical protein
VGELTSQQRAEVREEIAKAITEARQEMTDTLGLAAKIGSIAIGFAIAIVGYVGYSKLTDWREEGTEKIEEFVESNDALNTLQSELRQIRLNALVQYQRQRSYSSEDDEELEADGISLDDALLLLATAGDSATDEQMFLGIIDVLRASSSTSRWPAIEQEIIKLLQTNGAPERRQPLPTVRLGQLARLVSVSPRTSSWPPLRDILLADPPPSPEVVPHLVSIAIALDKELSPQALERLLRAFETDESVQRAVRAASTKWHASSPEFQQWFTAAAGRKDASGLRALAGAAEVLAAEVDEGSEPANGDALILLSMAIPRLIANGRLLPIPARMSSAEDFELSYCGKDWEECAELDRSVFSTDAVAEALTSVYGKSFSNDGLPKYIDLLNSLAGNNFVLVRRALRIRLVARPAEPVTVVTQEDKTVVLPPQFVLSLRRVQVPSPVPNRRVTRQELTAMPVSTDARIDESGAVFIKQIVGSPSTLTLAMRIEDLSARSGF